MKGLGEGDQLPGWQVGGKVLGAQVPPDHIGHPLFLRQPGSLAEHVGVSVDTDGLLEVRGEEKCQRTRSATHVQQPAGPVQPECRDQNLDDFSGVTDSPG